MAAPERTSAVARLRGRFEERSLPALGRWRQRRLWNRDWARDDFAADWLGRSPPIELSQAMADGWLPARGTALDVGCGEGEIARWLAEGGFRSVGVDFAEAALARARTLARDTSGVEFHCMDITVAAPPDLQYDVVVDRGCFHILGARDRRAYARNLIGVCAPDARFLLLVKAFRDGGTTSEDAERRRHDASVADAFGRHFRVENARRTSLAPDDRPELAGRLPGLAYRLRRTVG